MDKKMVEEGNATQKKIAEKDQQNVFDDIKKQLIKLNQSQDKVGDILKKQSVQDLKEKTQESEPQKVQEAQVESDEKQMGALRKTFEKSFGSIKESFSPGGLMKGFGLLSGSPIFMLMGDKLDDLIGQYSDFRKENKEADTIQEEANKESFMAEDIRDKELELAEKQNELLEDIRDKPTSVEDKKNGLLGSILGGITGIFSSILPKSLGKILPKLLSGGMLSKGIASTAGKGVAVAAAGFAGWEMGTWINKNITEALGQPLGGWIYDMVHGGFQDWWKSMKNTFKTWMSEIGAISMEIWDDFIAPFKNIGSWINDTITSATDGISNYISGIADKFTNLFDDVLGIFSFDDMSGVSDFGAKIMEKVRAFIEIITNPIAAIKSGLSFLAEKLGIKAPSDIDSDKANNMFSYEDPTGGVSIPKKNSSILDSIEETTNIQRQESANRESNRQQNIDNNQANNQSNNLIQSTQNNMIVQEDMNIKIDDNNLVVGMF